MYFGIYSHYTTGINQLTIKRSHPDILIYPPSARRNAVVSTRGNSHHQQVCSLQLLSRLVVFSVQRLSVCVLAFLPPPAADLTHN